MSRLTAAKLMRSKTEQEWLDYFTDREEKGLTRIQMAEELNTTKTSLRVVHERLFGKIKPGRPSVEKKFKGE